MVMLGDKQVLDQRERDELVRVAKKLAGRYAIEACCAYGSTVAGYARSDSDYDILLVLKKYDHIIKYRYEKDRLDVSALIVDSKSLVKDAEKAMLGEFVVGRLLHPYDPLINAKYIEDVEKKYKKRIVLEELRELVATDPLYTEIRIPVDYFLYSKLHKRARIYPHALYSYVKTYSDEQGVRNLAKSRESFLLALEELAEEGYIQLDGEIVKILGKIIASRGDKESLEVSNVMRGMFAWLVHTYAGRRMINFVKDEASSKLKRRKSIEKLPEMENPKILLGLEEGVRIEGRRWLKELATQLGFDDYYVTRRKLGDIHATTTLYTLSENGKAENFVVKNFASIKALKWAAMNVWAVGIKKFDFDPASRLRREYRAMRYLRGMGFNTPQIIAYVPDKKLLITRYIDGIRLSDIIESVLLDKSSDTAVITEWGRLLERLHAKGHTMMDTKPSNMLLCDNKLYLTDLEQFTFGDDKAWDIACFIYYSMKFTSNEAGARKVARVFLDGYMQNGNPSVIRKALNKKYISPFYPALVLGIITAVREEMRASVNAYS